LLLRIASDGAIRIFNTLAERAVFVDYFGHVPTDDFRPDVIEYILAHEQSDVTAGHNLLANIFRADQLFCGK